MKELIGSTPMIKINYNYKGIKSHLYAKLEYYNLTGSIKDRMALFILKKAKEDGILKDKMPLIEATSGNTGISLAALGAYFNHPVIIFMPNWVSRERVLLMESYGAKVHLVSKEEGGFEACIKMADELAKQINGYRPSQFDNIENMNAHYYTTGDEIMKQLPSVTGFISGIGSGGTLMGVGKRLKEVSEKIKVIAMEPDNLPLLRDNLAKGEHKIEGIGDDFIPSLVDINQIDDIIDVNDLDAINMSRKLAKELGLGVGISSGANFLASVLANEKYEGEMVTIFADDNKKYLSTDLSKEIDDDSNLLSNQIQLIDYEIIKN